MPCPFSSCSDSCVSCHAKKALLTSSGRTSLFPWLSPVPPPSLPAELLSLRTENSNSSYFSRTMRASSAHAGQDTPPALEARPREKMPCSGFAMTYVEKICHMLPALCGACNSRWSRGLSVLRSACRSSPSDAWPVAGRQTASAKSSAYICQLLSKTAPMPLALPPLDEFMRSRSVSSSEARHAEAWPLARSSPVLPRCSQCILRDMSSLKTASSPCLQLRATAAPACAPNPSCSKGVPWLACARRARTMAALRKAALSAGPPAPAAPAPAAAPWPSASVLDASAAAAGPRGPPSACDASWTPATTWLTTS
mmetsp:Transcript_57804/g.181507  ORF Transcript_57804/g.181507 Transcript_57804/m.181507 type:complete len:311 (-) Transcript_57804:645-1577(-)